MGRALAFTLALCAVAPTAAAQVQVVEENEVRETQVVERGYVRGQGRGIQYGAHLVSPIYLMSVASQDGRVLDVGGGIGVLGRVGWEFPSGFTVEVMGGIAANGVNTHGDPEMSNAMLRGEVGAGLRYMFFNETAFVPFVQAGGTLRWFQFDWPQRVLGESPSSRSVDWELTFALHGAVGAQVELSPYFGIEAGVAVDYTFWGDTFADGFVSLMPFAGVTLYVYDESGN